MGPYETKIQDDVYIHTYAAMTGQRAFRRHPSHVWEFQPQPKRRAGFTTNKRRGTPKSVRKMQNRSRRINRA